MKILYYFRNIDTMMFQWQRYHIFDELKTHGIDVEIVSPYDFATVENANQFLLKQIMRKSYDMFLTSFNEEFLAISTLTEIKNHGIPTVLFCPDNLTVPFRHKKISRYFDLVWLTAKETEYLFKKWGCNTIFQPYAANPFFLVPRYDVMEVPRVGFIGTPHGSRIDRINTLLSGQVPVTVYTAKASVEQRFLKEKPAKYLRVLADDMRFPIGRKLAIAAVKDKLFHRELCDPYEMLEQKKPVPLEKLSLVNGQYALVLSLTDADSTGVLKNPVPIVNLWNFEIPMSGGVQFTTFSEELASYFEPDKEIVMARGKEEYIDKAKFYLKPENARLRREIRVAARRRAESEHTWYHRFKAVFDELGIRI